MAVSSDSRKKGDYAAAIRAYVDPSKPRKRSTSYMKRLTELADKLSQYAGKGSLDAQADYYCYVYLDPRHPGDYEFVCPSGKVVRFAYRPFYVGKGKGRRNTAHLAGNLDDNSKSYKTRLLNKLRRLSLEPIIKTTPTRVPESMALALEIDLIEGIGRKDLRAGPLANRTAGGDGNIGSLYRHHSEETKKKIGAANKGKLKGRTLSEEHKLKISLGCRGKVASEEARRKISRANKGRLKGRTLSEEHRNKIRESLRNTDYKKEFSPAARDAAKKARQKKVKCPHCELRCTRINASRWHFDNCKHKEA